VRTPEAAQPREGVREPLPIRHGHLGPGQDDVTRHGADRSEDPRASGGRQPGGVRRVGRDHVDLASREGPRGGGMGAAEALLREERLHVVSGGVKIEARDLVAGHARPGYPSNALAGQAREPLDVRPRDEHGVVGSAPGIAPASAGVIVRRGDRRRELGLPEDERHERGGPGGGVASHIEELGQEG
jgi:hypothetical protein